MHDLTSIPIRCPNCGAEGLVPKLQLEGTCKCNSCDHSFRLVDAVISDKQIKSDRIAEILGEIAAEKERRSTAYFRYAAIAVFVTCLLIFIVGIVTHEPPPLPPLPDHIPALEGQWSARFSSGNIDYYYNVILDGRGNATVQDQGTFHRKTYSHGFVMSSEALTGDLNETSYSAWYSDDKNRILLCSSWYDYEEVEEGKCKLVILDFTDSTLRVKLEDFRDPITFSRN